MRDIAPIIPDLGNGLVIDPNIGKCGLDKVLRETVLTEDPHLEDLSRAAVKQEVPKDFQPAIPGSVDKHVLAFYVDYARRVIIRKMFDGLLRRYRRSGKNEEPPRPQQHPQLVERGLQRWRNMLEDVRTDDKIYR